MKKLEIEWFKTPYSLSEIKQGSGFLFSFVSAPRDGNRQAFPWILCRDYLHDSIRTHITGETCGVYGFRFSKKDNPPLDMRRTRMLVTKSDKKMNKEKFEDEIKYSVKLLNHFEDLMEVSHTKARLVSNYNKPVWYFNGPSVWMKSPVLISLYSMLLRLGYHKIEFDGHYDLIKKLKGLGSNRYIEFSDRDPGYMNDIANKITTLTKNYRSVFNIKPGKLGSSYDPVYREDIKIGLFHDYAGVVNTCTSNPIVNKEAAGKLKVLLAKQAGDSK